MTKLATNEQRVADNIPSPHSSVTLYLVLASVFLVSIFANLVDQNIEFFRDEGFESISRSARFYQLAASAPEGLPLLMVRFLQALKGIALFLFHDHGAMPNLFIAAVFAVVDGLNSPFTYTTFLLPTIVASAISSCLIFSISHRSGLSLVLSFAIAATFIFSPMYLGMSRGVGTNPEVFRTLSHALFVYCYIALHQDDRAKWYMIIPSVIIVFSDAVFYLWFIAFCAAIIVHHITYHSEARDMGARFAGSIRALKSEVGILTGFIGGLAIHSATYLVYPFIAGKVPKPMFFAVSRHELNFSIPSLPNVLDSMSLLFGIITPFLALAISVLYLCFFKKLNKVTDHFAAFLFFGYYFLLYILTDPSTWGNKTAYQGYLVLPILLLFGSVISYQLSARKGLVWVLTLVFLGSSFVGALNFVWKFHLPDSMSLTPAAAWGAHRPVLGSKSMGYLLRLYLIDEGIRNARSEFNVFSYRNNTAIENDSQKLLDDSEYYSSIGFSGPLAVYGGLQSEGRQIDFYTGNRASIRMSFDPSEAELADIDTVDAQTCETYYCVYAYSGKSQTETLYPFRFVRNGASIGTVWLPTSRIGPYASGNIDAVELENAFEKTFFRLTDFAPDFREQQYSCNFGGDRYAEILCAKN